MFSVRTIVLIVGAGVALAACDQAKPTATPPVPSASATTPAPASSPTATATATATRGSTATATASGPCPVTDRVLLAALKGTDIADRGSNPTALGNVVCYKNYAIARDTSPGERQGERAYFLFGYKQPQNRWTPLNLGTSDICTGYVLDKAIRDHLGEAC